MAGAVGVQELEAPVAGEGQFVGVARFVVVPAVPSGRAGHVRQSKWRNGAGQCGGGWSARLGARRSASMSRHPEAWAVREWAEAPGWGLRCAPKTSLRFDPSHPRRRRMWGISGPHDSTLGDSEFALNGAIVCTTSDRSAEKRRSLCQQSGVETRFWIASLAALVELGKSAPMSMLMQMKPTRPSTSFSSGIVVDLNSRPSGECSL